jgi:hypothetical protein
MADHDQVVALLQRIEGNQLKALEAQEQQLAYAKAQLERQEKAVSESLGLQRVAIARQAQVRNIALPLIVVVVVLLGYLLIKWRVVF